jgi:outer membrane receptor protein involved in Fe transport
MGTLCLSRRNGQLTSALQAFRLRCGLLSAIAANTPKFEEVVVTAQRKSESLQDTPISLVSFGSEDLEKAGIGGLDDLKASVPGMTMQAFSLNN